METLYMILALLSAAMLSADTAQNFPEALSRKEEKRGKRRKLHKKRGAFHSFISILIQGLAGEKGTAKERRKKRKNGLTKPKRYDKVNCTACHGLF